MFNRIKYTHEKVKRFFEIMDQSKREQDYKITQLETRLELAIKFIPASYVVEEIKDMRRQTPPLPPVGWAVVKHHPILGRFHSQLFPTKGCAEKSLKDHFSLLEFKPNAQDTYMRHLASMLNVNR